MSKYIIIIFKVLFKKQKYLTHLRILIATKSRIYELSWRKEAARVLLEISREKYKWREGGRGLQSRMRECCRGYTKREVRARPRDMLETTRAECRAEKIMLAQSHLSLSLLCGGTQGAPYSIFKGVRRAAEIHHTRVRALAATHFVFSRGVSLPSPSWPVAFKFTIDAHRRGTHLGSSARARVSRTRARAYVRAHVCVYARVLEISMYIRDVRECPFVSGCAWCERLYMYVCIYENLNA